jgi:Cu(I)/Ag(I) efflux system membrane fusion protein
MSTKHTTALLATLGLLLSVSAARAGTARFDGQMKPLYREYRKIHGALASDSVKGVNVAAKQIARLAGKLNPSSVTGEHAGHYRSLPGAIKASAVKLRRARGIAAKRGAFKELSRPLAMWATMSRPAGIKVYYCSMVRGSWLQSDRKTANPYYGARMLGCGEVVAGADRGAGSRTERQGHAR